MQVKVVETKHELEQVFQIRKKYLWKNNMYQ